MNRFLGVAASALSLLPFAAQAQMAGDVTLSFGRSDIQNLDEDVGTSYLGLSLSGDLGSNVTAGINFGLNRAAIDGFDADVEVQSLGANAAYRVGSGFSLGAYVQRDAVEASLLGIDLLGDLSATSLGLYAGYATGTVDVSGFLGRTTTDPDLPDGADITDFGLTARFQPTEASVVGAMLIRSELDSPAGDGSLTGLGLAGGVTLSETWSLFGGASRYDLDALGFDATTVGIGAGYKMPYFPGQLFAEVSRTNLSDGTDDLDVDSIQFGISFPFGKGGAQIPNGTVAGGILTDNFSTAAQALRLSF